jgi:hypothetical protein
VALAAAINETNFHFVCANRPPALVLAHELGHFLQVLTLGEQQRPTTKPTKAELNSSMESSKAVIMRNCINTPPNNGDGLFAEIWNLNDPTEMFNILPIANPPIGQLSCGDGILIAEAFAYLNADRHPSLNFSSFTSGDVIRINAGNAHQYVFTRMSHLNPDVVIERFMSLTSEEKQNFMECCARLLRTVTGKVEICTPSPAVPTTSGSGNQTEDQDSISSEDINWSDGDD